MTDYQNAEMKMFLEVSNFFNENSELTSSNSVIKKHVDSLNKQIADLESYKEKQEIDTTGYAKEKREAKLILAKTIFDLSAAVRSYANDTNKDPLFNEFKKSLSIIKKMADVDIVNYAKTMADAIKKNQKDLKNYGITADDLTELNIKIQEYEAILLKPAKQRKEKTVATDNIKKIISSINNVLSISLDNDMVQYNDTQADLYNKYLKMREIDDSQTTALSIKGTVVDANGKEPLQYVNVTAKFKAGKEWAEKVKSTTHLGNFQFKAIPDGKCKLIFELEYYDKLVVDTAVHGGEFTRVNVELVKTISN